MSWAIVVTWVIPFVQECFKIDLILRIHLLIELAEAINSRDLKRLTAIAKLVKEKNYESHMINDVKTATFLIERLHHIHGLWHDVLQMDQTTIAELKGYVAPPEAVHRIMMAAFLLLGNFTNETKVSPLYF